MRVRVRLSMLILGILMLGGAWERVHAGTYTVLLSDEQETALLYKREEINTKRLGQTDSIGNALMPLTQEEVFELLIVNSLRTVLQNLDASVIMPVLENLLALDADTLGKVLNTIKSPAILQRLKYKLSQMRRS